MPVCERVAAIRAALADAQSCQSVGWSGSGNFLEARQPTLIPGDKRSVSLLRDAGLISGTGLYADIATRVVLWLWGRA